MTKRLLALAFVACGSSKPEATTADAAPPPAADAAGATPGPEVTCGTPNKQMLNPANLGECNRVLGWVHIPDATSDDLSALARVRRIDGALTLFRNHKLRDLRGLEQLETIGGEFSIRLDDSRGEFQTLDGARSLREVGMLWIADNSSLRSLAGLSTLARVRGNVKILDNKNLPQAEIDALLARITVDGKVEVEGNGP